MDLGSTSNWTITSWPAGTYFEPPIPDAASWKSVYGAIGLYVFYSVSDVILQFVGITGNWIGDDEYLFPHLFGDSINDQGLSCGLLTLVGTKYQSRNPRKTNVFYGR